MSVWNCDELGRRHRTADGPVAGCSPRGRPSRCGPPRTPAENRSERSLEQTDLRPDLQNILRRTQGFSRIQFTCKIVRSSEIVFEN